MRGPASDVGLAISKAGATVPDKLALTVGQETLTYEELMAWSGNVARNLVDRGLGPGKFVGVWVEQTAVSVIGIIGTLLAGAAYVPVAADISARRLESISSAAQIDYWLNTEELESLALDGRILDKPCAETRRWEEEECRGRSEKDAAYVIFTSGSTGEPKGVVVSQAAILNSTKARIAIYGGEGMRYLMLSPLTCDASLAGLLHSFTTGNHLIMPTSNELLDPALLAETIIRKRVTHLDCLPSQYGLLLEYHGDALGSLNAVILGGETLACGLIRTHTDLKLKAVVYNEYGPTECAVWATYHRCSAKDCTSSGSVPIGKPIEGISVHIVGDDLKECEAGEEGEICLGGVGLAVGYSRMPSLSAEKFVPNPFVKEFGQRMYRTGDRGVQDQKGTLTFKGRNDQMVKVRGFRVDLMAVEAVLKSHPALLDAVVTVNNEGVGTVLSASLVIRNGEEISRAVLEKHLADRLPTYMIPSRWVSLDSMPRLSNGKVNRHELPDLGCGISRQNVLL